MERRADIAGDRIQEIRKAVFREDCLAEVIEPFDFTSALVGRLSFALDSRRQMTRQNASRATQFWVSAIVNVPIGGRKKKLKANAARKDMKTE